MFDLVATAGGRRSPRGFIPANLTKALLRTLRSGDIITHAFRGGGGMVDETGKVKTFADLYGLDNKLATALFGNATGFPMPPPEPKKPQGEAASASASIADRP